MMGEQAISERQARLWFWGVLALAVVLRVWTFRLYAVHHPDELYQYLEQANRIAFGHGIVPWEYREGMRSWLPPLLLSLPMRLGEAIAPGTLLPVAMVRALVALIELAPLAAAYALGSRLSRTHGLIALAAVAVWFESIYFSGHLLTELLSVSCFLPAAALIMPAAGRRALAAGGALLALAVLFRFHYAPAYAIFALITLNRHWRSWVPVIAGGLGVLAVSAVVDAAMGQIPFAWIVANFRVNLVESAADRFGIFGPLAYFQMMWLRWGVAMPLLLILPLFVARRYPGLLAAAVINLLVMMAIGHKEYRFIWLTVQILVLLSAIASADLLQKGLDRWRVADRGRLAAMLGLVALWAATSAALAAADPLWPNWNRFGARTAAVADAGRVDGLCGVAVHGIDYWSATHAYLRSGAPIYHPFRRKPADAAQALWDAAPAYNVIVAPAGLAAIIPPAYRERSCRDDGNERVCVWARSGGCDPAARRGELLQEVIRRHGY